MSEQRHIGPLFSAEDESCLTHVQMKDYAAGKISPAEKHHIERHLLNCELCALAFEGLADESPEAVAEGVGAIVDEAWSRVGALEKKRRRSAFVWMSSAAVILLLILVGFVVIDQQQDKKLDQLADSMYELPDAPEDDLESGAIASADALEEAEVNELAQPLEDARARGAAESRKENASPAPEMEALDLADADMSVEEPLELVEAEEELEIVEFDAVVVEKALENPADVKASPKRSITSTVTGASKDKDQSDYLAGGEMQNSNVGGGLNKPDSEGKLYGNGADISIAQDSTSFDPGYYADADNVDADDDEVADGFSFDMEEEDANEISFAQPEEVVTEGAISDNTAPATTYSQMDNGGNSTKTMTMTMSDVQIKEFQRMDQKQEYRNQSGSIKTRDKKSISKNRESKAKADAPVQQDELLSNETDYFRRGLEAYENRDFSKGARYLRQAASDTPSNLQAHFYAALCFMEMDQHTAALFHLDRIINSPTNSLSEEAKWYKSISLMRMGKKKQAETVLEEIREAGGKRKVDAVKVLDEF